jgi:hypothetical protein
VYSASTSSGKRFSSAILPPWTGGAIAVLDASQQPPTGVAGFRQAGTVFPGFWVADHQERDWGCRVIVADPDGRAVEINQRGHCTD